MSQAAVSDRYARALFELGSEQGQLDTLSRQLADFARTYEASVDLRNVLDNPLVPEPQREAVLQEVAARLGLNQLAKNALRLMAARRRLRAVPGVARRLARLADEKAGVVRATVVSARPLGDGFLNRLKAQLEHTSQARVVLEKETDPSLIAGVITRIGDRIIDASLRGRLHELERRLLA